MVVIFEIPLVDGSAIAKVVGMCQTISYSIHNEKMPVRVLGDMNMKNIVFGNRTIAGSMIFTVFDEHWSNELIDEYKSRIAKHYPTMLDDELPPINVTISMVNEYGDRSRLAIYGVTFVNEGQVMSINDTYTENTFQFYAKDIDYLTSDVNKNSGGEAKVTGGTNTINEVSPINNPPVDIPIQDTESSPEKIPQKEKRYDVYKGSYKDKERDVFMKELDQKYKELISYFKRDLDNNAISREQYEQEIYRAKRVWIIKRKEADDYYAQKSREEDNN
nr:MAG TPA: tail tube protein [Caudoviricetes sp.]